MVKGSKIRPLAHADAWELLPWMANETLAGDEAEALREHLASCALCRAELAACRDDRDRLRPMPSPGPAPHPVQFERLWARIESDEAESAEPRSRTRPPARRLWPWAVAAAAALAASAFLWSGWAPPRRSAFHTLSNAAPPASGDEIRVVFAEQTTEAQIRALLAQVGAEIVGGPSPLGVYTLRVASAPGREPVAWVVRQLRGRPEIRFAEPVVGGGG